MLIKITDHFWLDFDLLSRVIANTNTVDGEEFIYNVVYTMGGENVEYTIGDALMIKEFLHKLEWYFGNGEINQLETDVDTAIKKSMDKYKDVLRK